MDKARLLGGLENEWKALQVTWEGLADNVLMEPGVVGQWSLRDLLAHITTWEEEVLKSLPVIMEGHRLPRYGDIDAFNARDQEKKRSLALSEVKRELATTHEKLLRFLVSLPEVAKSQERRFLHRLRLDTYNHYREHAAEIREWRLSRFRP